MFQILEFTEARLLSVTNRTEKHGDEEVPAITIGVELTAANTLLDCIDPTLRQALYKTDESQPSLPDVESSTPVLRCYSIESLKLPTKHEGWTLTVDDGIDDTQPMTFGGCKVDKFIVEPKQGGSIVLRLRIGTSDIDAERLGKLGMHNGQSIWIKLTQPEKPADVIDGTNEAFRADHPSAGDLFAGAHGGDQHAGDFGAPGPDDGTEGGGSDSEGGDTDVRAESPAQAQPAPDGWPFGASPANPLDDRPVGSDDLPPRDDDDDLERGMAASIAKQKLKAKYRNTVTGDTWSGRGLQPAWLKRALSEGKALVDFEIAGTLQ
jgi:hypothetical protein